jgi:hypothetical protein
MNLKAKCVNPKCPNNGYEKSVVVGQLLGYGAPNDRIKCPACGELMRTTRSINVSSTKRSTRRIVGRQVPSRSTLTRTRKRTTGKRTTKRAVSKR